MLARTILAASMVILAGCHAKAEDCRSFEEMKAYGEKVDLFPYISWEENGELKTMLTNPVTGEWERWTVHQTPKGEPTFCYESTGIGYFFSPSDMHNPRGGQ